MIYFVGAGPGAVDLITVRGSNLLRKADVVIYTGSLVWEQHLACCPQHCLKFNSAGLTLEEVLALMKKHDNPSATIVRLHTGDPTLYGAIREQIDALCLETIAYEIVPGVSSFTAACAAINREFTVPGISQTVIVTRLGGKTPVPALEDLELLARHQCSLAIFLSVQEIDTVVEKLTRGYQRSDVPVAIVYKATWPDQAIILGTLADIGDKVKQAGIKRFTQILVGDFITGPAGRSQLYHPDFSHGYRTGKT